MVEARRNRTDVEKRFGPCPAADSEGPPCALILREAHQGRFNRYDQRRLRFVRSHDLAKTAARGRHQGEPAAIASGH